MKFPSSPTEPSLLFFRRPPFLPAPPSFPLAASPLPAREWESIWEEGAGRLKKNGLKLTPTLLSRLGM